MDVIKVILTALLSVAALFIVTKMMGHKQVAQLDFFDYVSGITIGSIGAELATELEAPHKPLLALAVYGGVSLLLNRIAHNLDDIQAAFFEHNGKLSILPRAQNRPATPSDLGIEPRATHIGVEVIMDGRVMGENLRRMGRDERWLDRQITAQGFRAAGEIFLGVYRPEEDKLTLYPGE